MRLIDADELLTAFPVDDEPTLTKACVRMTIQHMPTIEPEPHWIPVTERLPGPVTYVLVADPEGDMALAKIVDTVEGLKWDINMWVNDLEDWPVWMPLPEPWKGENNDRT